MENAQLFQGYIATVLFCAFVVSLILYVVSVFVPNFVSNTIKKLNKQEDKDKIKH